MKEAIGNAVDWNTWKVTAFAIAPWLLNPVPIELWLKVLAGAGAVIFIWIKVIREWRRKGERENHE